MRGPWPYFVALAALAAVLATLLVAIASPREPFRRACTGELESVPHTFEAARTAARGAEVVATVDLPREAGREGYATTRELGPFVVRMFPFGSDPPVWIYEATLPGACGGPEAVGLGQLERGTIELRQSNDRYFVVTREPHGFERFVNVLVKPRAAHVFAMSRAGTAMLVALSIALAGFALARRTRRAWTITSWDEGVVSNDGRLEVPDGASAIPLDCECAFMPGTKVLFRCEGAISAPYRAHAAARLAEHVRLSRDEAIARARRASAASITAALAVLAVIVVAMLVSRA
jgi:hypothetical protein